MNTLSIRLKIADREYPMTVEASEEERIRKASKLINDKLKAYKEEFGIEDNQDLLAMVAFDALIDQLRNNEKHSEVDEAVVDKLEQLNQVLNGVAKS